MSQLLNQSNVIVYRHFMRIKHSDMSSFVITWQGNYEEREGKRFISIRLVETCIEGYRVLFHVITPVDQSTFIPQ